MPFPAGFLTLDEALKLDPARNSEYHHQHLNPRLSSLLEAIEADKRFSRASGSYLWDEDGNRYLDLVSGCGALNLGHNHPRLRMALDKIDGRPNLVETLDPLQGALANNLATLMHGKMQRVYFVNSGAEAVDTAIKMARSATRRPKLVACNNGFHGRTVGALSVTQRPEYREPFGQLLTPVEFVPFGSAGALEAALRDHRAACFIVEPIQGEGGIIVPENGYLRSVREICSRYGTLMVADEVQTGLGRTGTLFAVEHDGVCPDILVLGKALGAGMIPLSAVLTTDEIFRTSGGGTVRTPFHHTTYGGYPRACAVCISTLEAIVEEDLASRAAASGQYVLDKLRRLQESEPLIANVRGRGLFIGIELSPATSGITTVLTAGLIKRLSETYFTGLIMMHLLGEYRIITAFTLNRPNVLRLEPPLNIECSDLDYFVSSLGETLRCLRSFPQAVLRSLPTAVKALSA